MIDKKERYCIVLLVISLSTFVGCIEPTPSELPVQTLDATKILPTSVVEESMELVPSPTPDHKVSCTELGCDNYLRVGFAGILPQNYIVEISDHKERKVVLQCFEPAEGDDYSYSPELHALSSPDIHNITRFSSAPQMCENDADGMAGKNLWDGEIVLVSCSAWSARQFRESLDASACFYFEDYSGFQLAYPDEFLPQELSMIIHWETYSKTVDLLPEYEIDRPNGPMCEPACSETHFTIELP